MKSNLITAKGYAKLTEELDHLWRVERPEITKIVTWAASLGDRSENADYQYNKRRLREIDRRVRYLRKRLEEVQVVHFHPQQAGKVFFGAFVELSDEAGEILKFQIAGPDEIYQQKNVISIDSPMARACLKKEIGDEVLVTTPAGKKLWFVEAIHYEKDF